LRTRFVGSDVFSAPSLIKLIQTFAKEKGGELFERIFNTADVFSLSLLTFPKDRRFFAESSSNILSLLADSPKAFVLRLRLRLFLSSFF
jgi:hypothetical protein